MSPSHHESHTPSYGNDSWAGLGTYTQSGQQHGNGGQNAYHGYDYTTSTPMPLEPSYPMSRPPPYATPQHSQMPPPLIMPHAAVSTQTPVSATSMSSDITPTSAKASSSRRKLTDDERRLMCLEAENNPTMKQTQIGAKFNVERRQASPTVSKILRQKEKYMKVQAKEEVTSPGKKPKMKLPDVEKTLANWARNQQKKGLLLTTDELRKQVLMFTSGRTDQQVYTSTEWLENFQKHHLHSTSRTTSREDTAETSTSHSETLDNSPISVNGLVSPPISAIEESALRSNRGGGIFDFDVAEYEQSPSLTHGFPSDSNLSSGALMSPVSPELGRDYVSSMFEDDGIEMSSRQRSMTLPQLVAISASRPGSSHTSLPALPVRSVSNANHQKQVSVDPRQTMKRHKSVPDIHEAEGVRYSTMQPPPLPRSADISPISMPGSPSYPDDTIKALHNIKKILEQRPDVAEPDDYVMIGKLMEKLKLLKTRSPTGTPMLPGGMHHVEMMDSPRLSKKRTMIEMSM
ncbi:hypothetical protein LTS08_000777 [Lithohypha guttulata]|uniref:uncharacterized protein n=1 Tax=Lithohypha guttulata TaxID=1690604 RepID=UPI002DE0A7B3|nr:hypothetical protein LTR51_006612 [Lithohypha guttulata]KAK5106656.1 hypothetical protein LTS08_000777 [Lithohypha guttulata]